MDEARAAHWITYEDDERLCLQIELGNDYAVTLTYPKDGETLRARLWHGSGELDCGQDTIEAFRAWLRAARRSGPPFAERRRLLTGELCLRRSEARVEHHGVTVDRHDLLRHEEGPGLVSLLRRSLFSRWRQKLGGDGGAARVWRVDQEFEGQVEHEAGRMIVTELPVEWPSDNALQAVEARFHARRLPRPRCATLLPSGLRRCFDVGIGETLPHAPEARQASLAERVLHQRPEGAEVCRRNMLPGNAGFAVPARQSGPPSESQSSPAESVGEEELSDVECQVPGVVFFRRSGRFRSGFQPAMIRAHSLAWALSRMPGKRRRSSTSG